MKVTKIFIFLFASMILIFAILYHSDKVTYTDSRASCIASKEYISLLSKFPKEKQGYSLEPSSKPEGPSGQPNLWISIIS